MSTGVSKMECRGGLRSVAQQQRQRYLTSSTSACTSAASSSAVAVLIGQLHLLDLPLDDGDLVAHAVVPQQRGGAVGHVGCLHCVDLAGARLGSEVGEDTAAGACTHHRRGPQRMAKRQG